MEKDGRVEQQLEREGMVCQARQKKKCVPAVGAGDGAAAGEQMSTLADWPRFAEISRTGRIGPPRPRKGHNREEAS